MRAVDVRGVKMVQRRYLSVADLPPRPGLSTGLPRPPRAPGFIGPEIPLERDSSRERDPASAPSPPPGQSPVVVWYRKSRRGALIAVVTLGLLVAGVATLTRGTSWMTVWGAWAVFVIFLVAVYFFFRGGRYSAGADWVARGKKWVRVYELVKVTCHTYPGGRECACGTPEDEN
jgi:hypothetical protein